MVTVLVVAHAGGITKWVFCRQEAASAGIVVAGFLTLSICKGEDISHGIISVGNTWLIWVGDSCHVSSCVVSIASGAIADGFCQFLTEGIIGIANGLPCLILVGEDSSELVIAVLWASTDWVADLGEVSRSIITILGHLAKGIRDGSNCLKTVIIGQAAAMTCFIGPGENTPQSIPF